MMDHHMKQEANSAMLANTPRSLNSLKYFVSVPHFYVEIYFSQGRT